MRLIEFYTDGACPGNGRAGGGRMGAGIVARSGEIRKEWAIPLGMGTNQQAELLAIREALKKISNRADAHVVVYTDSAYAIGCLTRNWKIRANAEIIDEVRALIRECGRFEIRKVAGHAGVEDNERADRLAVQATTLPA